MENLYDYIEQKAKEAGYKNITEFCKSAEIPRATMSELKAGRTKQLSAKTATAVSNKLRIPLNALLNAEEYNPMVYCEECGVTFNENDKDDVLEHAKRHLKWAEAEKKFGFCWNYQRRENLKAEARQIRDNPSIPLPVRIEAELTVFKALFSRSLESSDYNLNHVDFPTYISMMLNQGNRATGTPNDVYNDLVSEYGKKPGITSGTYYKPDTPETKKDTTLSGDVSELSKDVQELIAICKSNPALASALLAVAQQIQKGQAVQE